MARPISDEEREELTAYLDGEAEPAERARIEARMNSEPAIRAEADALKKVWELLDTLPQPEPSPTFTSKTLDRLSAIRPVSTNSTTQPWVPSPSNAMRIPWSAIALGVGGLAAGWFVAGFFGPTTAPIMKIDDPVLVHDLRIIKDLPMYTAVESLEYLQALDKTNRFDADSVGP